MLALHVDHSMKQWGKEYMVVFLRSIRKKQDATKNIKRGELVLNLSPSADPLWRHCERVQQTCCTSLTPKVNAPSYRQQNLLDRGLLVSESAPILLHPNLPQGQHCDGLDALSMLWFGVLHNPQDPINGSMGGAVIIWLQSLTACPSGQSAPDSPCQRA